MELRSCLSGPLRSIELGSGHGSIWNSGRVGSGRGIGYVRIGVVNIELRSGHGGVNMELGPGQFRGRYGGQVRSRLVNIELGSGQGSILNSGQGMNAI
jgi:hypothetical protein